MESFEYQGVFWKAAEPDAKVPGRVAFSVADGVRLELAGRFGSLDPKDGDYPLIHGVVEGGKLVTILDAYSAGMSLGGPTQERIRGQILLQGVHCADRPSQSFHDVSISTELLQPWSKVQPLDTRYTVKRERLVGLEVKYTFPPVGSGKSGTSFPVILAPGSWSVWGEVFSFFLWWRVR